MAMTPATCPTDPRELAAYIARLRARLDPRPPWGTLEELFTSCDGFNVPASPLQRAICRVADGRALSDLWDDGEVRLAFGGVAPEPGAPPLEQVTLAGIRGGKSMLAAACILHWSQRVTVDHLSPGDVPRVASVSITKDLAQAVYDHLEGNTRAKPQLRALLLEEPTAGRLVVRHPTGRPIEVVVAAGARGGASLVARWIAGVVFDEFALMSGEGEAVINWGEQRKAVRNRILPGGGIWHIGSPWAPVGPAFAMVRDHHGKPSRDLVVVKAPGWAMNPSHWTPERVAAAKVADPDAYQMTVAAEFGTPPEAMFANELLQRATRAELEQPADPDATYTAAIDPATRGNGWTLVVATRRGDRRIVALAREWRGSRVEPLDPDVVVAEIADVLRPYRVRNVLSDQWAADALKSIMRRRGLTLVESTSVDVWERYQAFRTRLEAGELELPPEPQMQGDLRRVQKVVTTRGFGVRLPHTADGRHCDYAPAVMLAVDAWTRDVVREAPAPGSPTALQREGDAMKAQALRRRDPRVPFWKRGPGR